MGFKGERGRRRLYKLTGTFGIVYGRIVASLELA